MKKITLKLIGVGPMLMHADTYVDALNPATKAYKALTQDKVKKGTDAGLEEIMFAEMLGALYYRDDIGIHIPSANIQKCFTEAARLRKQGKNIERGVIVLDDSKLIYTGPQGREELAKSPAFRYGKSIVQGRSRIMRYRPIFNKWSADVEIMYQGDIIDRDQIILAAEEAGRLIGIGDWRPRFGRFTVEVLEG